MPLVRYTLPGALRPWETRPQSPHDLCLVPALPPTSSSAASWWGCHASPLDHWKVMNWPLSFGASISPCLLAPTSQASPGFQSPHDGPLLSEKHAYSIANCFLAFLYTSPPGSSWSVQEEGSSFSYQSWQLAGTQSVLAEWKNAGGAGGQEMEEMKQKVEDG